MCVDNTFLVPNEYHDNDWKHTRNNGLKLYMKRDLSAY